MGVCPNIMFFSSFYCPLRFCCILNNSVSSSSLNHFYKCFHKPKQHIQTLGKNYRINAESEQKDRGKIRYEKKNKRSAVHMGHTWAEDAAETWTNQKREESSSSQ